MTGPFPGPRASDEDRERFCRRLERHFADGRLSAEELSQRIDAVLASRTLGELYALISDLPDLPAVEITTASKSRRRRLLRRRRP